MSKKTQQKVFSNAGNRTPVSCVTGGNTGHCTTSDGGIPISSFEMAVNEDSKAYDE